ncbi:MAG: 50S ribosomal protein L25 [Spirochaetales bacterium]|nr:50S ribosomal protein L25 [Spirochaetales bacterium]
MDSKTLTCAPRTDFGKGGAKRVRKEGKIPAVIYGHNEPVSISIDAREFSKKFHTVSENTIITLKDKDKSYDVLVKEYQDDILTEKILHIDFFEIERGKVLKTHVPVHTTGNAIGVKLGGVLEVSLHELEIECLPKDLPQEIVVDITPLELNASVHVSDITPPAGVKILTAPETSVLHIATIKKEEAAPVAEESPEAAESEDSSGSESEE